MSPRTRLVLAVRLERIEQLARDLFMISRSQARRRDGEDVFGECFCEI